MEPVGTASFASGTAQLLCEIDPKGLLKPATECRESIFDNFLGNPKPLNPRPEGAHARSTSETPAAHTPKSVLRCVG